VPEPRRGLRRSGLLAILGVIALLAALAGLKACQISKLIDAGKAAERAGRPPETVSTTRAEQEIWERTLRAVASVVTARGVQVSNDAPGTVARLHFESGESVRRGRILVELDTSVERAELKSTLARLEGAEIAARRSRVLAAEGVVAEAERDADEATYRSLKAEAASLGAQIERKIVRAPFDGRLGLREVNLGQYLPSGTTIVVLESKEPDYVDFGLPQQTLELLRVGMPVRVHRGQSEQPTVEAAITAIDPRLDPVTRSVDVRARLPGGHGLRPGMFVDVHVILPERVSVVAVPQSAVQRAAYGSSVFVVETESGPGPAGKPRRIARQKFVRLGEARGDFVAVLEGLKAGEEVVTSGGFKLQNGAPVVVSDKVKLTPELEPRPENR
jgi:membrane fusion protein (multidrug efflux system)